MSTASPRLIGDPERRGSTELRPFRYDPAHTGTIAGVDCKIYDDATDVDVTTTVLGATPSVTLASGVISTNTPAALRAEQVLRVHFIFTVDGAPYNEFRKVIVEK